MDNPYPKTRSLYDRAALHWNDTRNQSLFEKPWLDKLLSALGPKPHILYMGCGTAAPLGGYLISQDARITGVDFSPEMIKRARAQFPDQNFVVEDIRSYAPDETYDGILDFSALFHLTAEDQARQIPRYANLLRPGGVGLFASGTKRGVVYGRVSNQPVFHSSLELEEYRDAIEAADMRVRDHVVEDEACGGFTFWLFEKLKTASKT